MPEPEISHRCTSCGASVRGHALFCPQCGYPLTQTPKTVSETADGEASATPAADISPALAADIPEAVKGGAPVEDSASSEVKTPTVGEPEVAPNETADPTEGSVPELKAEVQSGNAAIDDRRRPVASTALAANRARTKIKQATTAARDKIEDNVRPRVDKIRQASSVVLEEANYDPSVRFILVAGVLFVLFVVLLIISKVI
ncbi:MAG: zinc-ribbon domain [Blastocatellia bacterium]|jgi:hypothetical protein|nr:zinc-ribbon domain [Blastocatellia bacterium]